jgi:eukaryotic-like serine/threonine-protein kinase
VSAPASTAQRQPWQSGDVVGQYTLLAKIATGGMADIWLARQAGLHGFEKVAAIKRISDNYCDSVEFVEMFLDEARIAAQLNHPNIVQIHDLGQHGGAYYIAMEYLHGEDFSTVVRTGAKIERPVPIPIAVKLVAMAADGLAYAHAKAGLDGKPLHIVHRDMSPQNLFVSYDGNLKIVDFGIAKAASRVSHTIGRQLKGKLSYLSPEQAKGLPTDGRSDLFSLGVVLYEAVGRCRLFQFDDTYQALMAIANIERVPSVRTRNPEVPESLANVIARALERNPEDRYPTTRQFQLALEDWLRKEAEAPGTVEISMYMSTLFADRIAQRTRLLESARAGELTPSKIAQDLRKSKETSMPGATPAPVRADALASRPATSPTAPGTPAPPVKVIDLDTMISQAETVPGSRRRRALMIGGTALVIVLLGALGISLAVGRHAGDTLPAVEASATPNANPVMPSLLRIETDPKGAQISVDGQDYGPAPVELASLSVGEHRIEAAQSGRLTATRIVKIGREGDHVQLVIALAVDPNPPGPHPPPTPPKQVGRLTFDTVPWTHVFLGKKKLGDTPLLDVSIPSGKQVLQLINEEKGINQAYEIEIKPGKSTSKRIKL